MIVRSLKEIVSAHNAKAAISEVILSNCSDLSCTNLFCEKVGQACICKLERVMERVDLSNVKKVDISGNQLDMVPPFIGRCNNIEELVISNNKISSLPDFINNLSNLKAVKS